MTTSGSVDWREYACLRSCPPKEAVKLISRWCRWLFLLHHRIIDNRVALPLPRCPVKATLILLDGEEAVICREGQEHLWADPTGKNLPWPSTTSRLPQVGFDLMSHMRPDVACLSRPLQPPGTEKPPTFQRKESASRNTWVVLPERMLAVSGTRADQRTVPPGQYKSPRVGSPVGQTWGEVLGADSMPGTRAKKQKASPPDTVPPKKPPPKPNLDSRRVKAVASATFVTKGVDPHHSAAVAEVQRLPSVGSNWNCNSGWVQVRMLLESMEDALPPLSPSRRQVGERRHGPTPHVCCCRAGRTVWSWSLGQGSVSRKGSQACCPKACFGRTSQPPTCLPCPAIA